MTRPISRRRHARRLARRPASLVLAAAVLAASAAVLSARTETFLETNQAQFDKGEFKGLVATNLGRLRLGRALDNLLAETEGVEYVARCAVGPDGALYAVTGGAGRIYRAKDGKVTLYATLPDAYLFSIVADKNGDLYVGSGGTAGRIWRIAPPAGGKKQPEAETVFEDPAVKYVWDLAWLPDGTLAAATGDQGRLLRIRPDGKADVLIDTKADHVLCLAVGPDGTLYAGTDGEALVYRWADGKPFVLYDAAENEITALAVDAAGNLYVGASSGEAGRRAGVTIRPSAAPKPPAPAQGTGGGKSAASGSEARPTPVGTAAAEANKIAHTVRAAQKARASGSSGASPQGGSAVYRIDPDGIVTPLMDADEPLLLALAVVGDRLLVGTGGPARLYEVVLARDGEEQARLAELDPKQVMAIAVGGDGRPVVATAGPGRLYVLSEGYARQGTYTSQVYDAGGSARWGLLDWRAAAPEGTEVALATRTGNVRDPEKGMWSPWSKAATKPPAAIASPPARFIQFRVTMKTARPDRTPVLEQFEAAYRRANERPRVLEITEVAFDEETGRAQAVERFRQAMKQRAQNPAARGSPPRPPAPEGSQPIRILRWKAEDPNGDRLRYRLYFRGQGEKRWILLEEDLARPEFAWNTATVADGWYELKVVATDAPDNPADEAKTDERVSDPILVDNTAPAIENLRVKVEKAERGGRAVVTFTARDAASRLTEAAYTVDSADRWQTLAPEDGIFDASTETFRFTVEGLAPGPHRIAVRAVDEGNNRGHAAAAVEVPE